MENKCEHIELSTDDPARAVAFYARVFGWKIETSEMPGGGTYHMFRTANGGGGIAAKMNKEQPTAWMPYVTVGSVKAAQKAARAAGATPIPQFEYVSMGDMGAIGGFIDPTGGAIGLYESGKPAPAPGARKGGAPKPKPGKAASKGSRTAKAKTAGKKPARNGAQRKR